MMKMILRTTILPLFLCAAALIGCNDFERTSFQSLTASKAVIDQAQASYEAGAMPRTNETYTAITKAKQGQTAAVDALLAYESIRGAKGSAQALQAQQQIVVAALAEVALLTADVRALTTGVPPVLVPSPGLAAHAIPPPGS